MTRRPSCNGPNDNSFNASMNRRPPDSSSSCCVQAHYWIGKYCPARPAGGSPHAVYIYSVCSLLIGEIFRGRWKMPMYEEPVVGAFYEDEDGRSFEVIAFDEND